MAREIYERDTDSLFLRSFAHEDFLQGFLNKVLPGQRRRVVEVQRQRPHVAHTGTIDIVLRLDDGQLLLIENKINAGYSVTRSGDAQPERYRATVLGYADRGIAARSVLLAPAHYLSGSKNSGLFDAAISYEELRGGIRGKEDLALLEAAIAQAAAPYEPDPNEATAEFFAQYYELAAALAPDLVLKSNPNGSGVRPTGSRTIYVEVPRTLRLWADIPRPKMSIQCLDSGASTASVKIMISGLGRFASQLVAPVGLQRIGGYLRPAGQSLGCVIDTPRLNTQQSFQDQRHEVEKGLQAAMHLCQWWNSSEREVLGLCKAPVGLPR